MINSEALNKKQHEPPNSFVVTVRAIVGDNCQPNVPTNVGQVGFKIPNCWSKMATANLMRT